jgi:hypothetical protein
LPQPTGGGPEELELLAALLEEAPLDELVLPLDDVLPVDELLAAPEPLDELVELMVPLEEAVVWAEEVLPPLPVVPELLVVAPPPPQPTAWAAKTEPRAAITASE